MEVCFWSFLSIWVIADDQIIFWTVSLFAKIERKSFSARWLFSLQARANFMRFCSGGKSAILTAITVGLGGKIRFTGRGSSLSAAVKEGKQCVPYIPFKKFFLYHMTPKFNLSAPLF
jgi:hypothetical protein